MRAVVTVGLITALVRLAALCRELLVAREYGVGAAVDAFVVAFLVPMFAVAVLAESLNSALLPTFARARQADRATAERLLSNSLTLAVPALILASILIGLAAPVLVTLVAPGFDRETSDLAVRLLWMMLPLIALSGIASIWMAVLTAGERFLAASFAPVLVPLTAGAAILLAGETLGVQALALGTVLGYGLQLLPLAHAVRKAELRIRPSWGGLSPELRLVLAQYAPLALGTFLNSGRSLVDQAFASSLGDGRVSVLFYGNRVVALATGVIAVAVGTAILPYFSRQVADGDLVALRRTIKVWFVLVGSAASVLTLILVVLSDDLVALMFQGGEFSQADTDIVTAVQRAYLLQLPLFAVGVIAVRAVSALGRNSILLWGAAINLGLNVILNFFFVELFGVLGIALATSAVYAVSVVYILLMLWRPLNPIRSQGAT